MIHMKYTIPGFTQAFFACRALPSLAGIQGGNVVIGMCAGSANLSRMILSGAENVWLWVLAVLYLCRLSEFFGIGCPLFSLAGTVRFRRFFWMILPVLLGCCAEKVQIILSQLCTLGEKFTAVRGIVPMLSCSGVFLGASGLFLWRWLGCFTYTFSLCNAAIMFPNPSATFFKMLSAVLASALPVGIGGIGSVFGDALWMLRTPALVVFTLVSSLLVSHDIQLNSTKRGAVWEA